MAMPVFRVYDRCHVRICLSAILSLSLSLSVSLSLFLGDRERPWPFASADDARAGSGDGPVLTLVLGLVGVGERGRKIPSFLRSIILFGDNLRPWKLRADRVDLFLVCFLYIV
jgi:hypothetical protein